MTDQKKINRLKLLLELADRALAAADPDLRIVQKLLHGAYDLALEMTGPPDPYADMNLRPGLRRSETTIVKENPDG